VATFSLGEELSSIRVRDERTPRSTARASRAGGGGYASAVRLVGKQVVLRTGEPEDVTRLASIANEPEVAAWWGHTDEVEVAARFVNNETSFIVAHVGELVGAIQYDEEDNPMYRRAGIDIFLTTSRHGQGLATDSIRTLAWYLFEERGHHLLTIDPAVDNERAIRAYEAVGFGWASCARTNGALMARGMTAC